MMFDFFRDAVLEAKGIDSSKAKKLRDEEREIKKLSQFIFTKSVKRVVIILGALYTVFSVLSIVNIFMAASDIGSSVVVHIIKTTLLIMISIVACISLVIGSKKGEIVALVCCIVFAVLLYLFFIVL